MHVPRVICHRPKTRLREEAQGWQSNSVSRRFWLKYLSSIYHVVQFLQHGFHLLTNGPFTPAIFSTIAWTCTIRVILNVISLNGTVQTCDFFQLLREP